MNIHNLFKEILKLIMFDIVILHTLYDYSVVDEYFKGVIRSKAHQK